MTDIDNLQIEYARGGSLELYRKVSQAGANKWSESAVLAGAYSPEIVAYLIELFTHPRRPILLSAYATMRYLNIFGGEAISLEEYLAKNYKEPNPNDIWESIAFGAATVDDLDLVEKCIALGAKNFSLIVQGGIASGGLKILSKYFAHLKQDVAMRIAIKNGSFAAVQFLESKYKMNKKELIKLAVEHGRPELAAYFEL